MEVSHWKQTKKKDLLESYIISDNKVQVAMHLKKSSCEFFKDVIDFSEHYLTTKKFKIKMNRFVGRSRSVLVLLQ